MSTNASGTPRDTLESRIGRFLGLATAATVGVLAAGTVVLLATGHSPLDASPSLDPGRLVADLAAGQPAGLLWLGLLGVVMTPGARVVAAFGGYLLDDEPWMAVVAVLILLVIGAGVAAGAAGA